MYICMYVYIRVYISLILLNRPLSYCTPPEYDYCFILLMHTKL